MKYIMRICARPDPAMTMEEKHDQVIAGWPQAQPDMILKATPTLRPLGTDMGRTARLTKCLAGQVRGDLFYRIRNQLGDDGACDDWLDVTFNPARVGYADIVSDWLPKFLGVFGAYRGDVLDEDLAIKDMKATMGKPGWNPRSAVFRVAPVSFFDGELCRRGFGLSAPEVAECLSGLAERVDRIGDGVYVLGSSKPLDNAAADALSKRLESAVRGMK